MRIGVLYNLLVLATIPLLWSTQAHALTLELPIDCEVGKDCFVQNYVDRDSGTGYQDYRCGPLSYDGHKGTDIRLKNLAEMRAGVDVITAAAGTVRGVRDEMPDEGITKDNKDAIANRECGNGIVVVHEDGWETQYCHMMRGSIVVKPGQLLKVGDVIGKVGLSGSTEFPHVHLSVRKDGRVVDPFVGDTKADGCQVERHPLWSKQTLAMLDYRSTAVLGLGFTDSTPNVQDVREGGHRAEILAPDAPALIFWSDVMGLLKGDIAQFTITAPDGSTLLTQDMKPLDRSKAVMFQYVGKRHTKDWQPGVYTGTYTVLRDGKEVVTESTKVLVGE